MKGRKTNTPRTNSGTHGYADGGRAGGKWIQDAIKRPGSLHKALDIPEGETIPTKKLGNAAKSENPALRRKAVLAETLKNFKK